MKFFEEMTFLESASDIAVCALQYSRQEKAFEITSFGEKVRRKAKNPFLRALSRRSNMIVASEVFCRTTKWRIVARQNWLE